MIIYIRLIFITLGPIPSEVKIVELANSLLDSRFRIKRDLRAQSLNTPVSFVNVTYKSKFSLLCSVASKQISILQ